MIKKYIQERFSNFLVNNALEQNSRNMPWVPFNQLKEKNDNSVLLLIPVIHCIRRGNEKNMIFYSILLFPSKLMFSAALKVFTRTV